MDGIGEVGSFRAVPAPVLERNLNLARNAGEATIADDATKSDVVELSPQAELIADLSREHDIRVDKVAQIRAQIESGQYDLTMNEKLAASIDRIIEDL